ncbi:MAG: M20/M25/M40 family metallo-hydrolase, partial [Dehalococcoidia bacterium]
VFAAHLDSKTDFWDHIQRARVYSLIPIAVVLGLILAIFTLFSSKYASLENKAVTSVVLTLAGIVVVYWGLVFVGFGGYIFMPPNRQSYGSVDDGASVATLLAVSKDIHDGKVALGNSRVTILLTSGEETNLQGADAYVKALFYKGARPDLPISLVNLELVGQNGPMIYWKKDGEFLIFYNADAGLITRVGEAWKAESGKDLEPGQMYTTDDAQRFMAADIPAVTISNSGEPGLGVTGFHSTADNPARVNVDNLKLMVRVLERYIESY